MGGVGQGRVSTAQLMSLVPQVPPGQLTLQVWDGVESFPSSSSPSREPGCCSKLPLVRSSLPYHLQCWPLWNWFPKGWGRLCGNNGPAQLSLLSCGTQASLLQGWFFSQSTTKCIHILNFALKKPVLWNSLSKIGSNSSVYMASGWCWLGHKYLTAWAMGMLEPVLGRRGMSSFQALQTRAVPAIWTCCSLLTVNLSLPVVDLYLNFPVIFNINSLCFVHQKDA